MNSNKDTFQGSHLLLSHGMTPTYNAAANPART